MVAKRTAAVDAAADGEAREDLEEVVEPRLHRAAAALEEVVALRRHQRVPAGALFFFSSLESTGCPTKFDTPLFFLSVSY